MSIKEISSTFKDVGGIPVARFLPNQQGKRTIGPWCFLDNAGPSHFAEDERGLQVGLHPHTNLQTFTWMLSGDVVHHDSKNHAQTIKSGQVNLMTAGTGLQRGISHIEQTPDYSHELHAIQLWIALPMQLEIEPSFYHYPELPSWQHNQVQFILMTGEFEHHRAPTLQYSPLIGMDVSYRANGFEQTEQTIQLPLRPGFEYGILLLKGQIQIGGQRYQGHELLVLIDEHQNLLEITLSVDTHFIWLGGEPLPHKTLLWWNFVDNDVENLKQSIIDWNNHHPRFGDIDLTGTGLTRLVAPPLPEHFKIL